jgi:hypothetical protein
MNLIIPSKYYFEKEMQTLDGSTTIQIKEWDECYHSKHGAIKKPNMFYKKRTVFISKQQISILKLVSVPG